jgi:hypothetical protein
MPQCEIFAVPPTSVQSVSTAEASQYSVLAAGVSPARQSELPPPAPSEELSPQAATRLRASRRLVPRPALSTQGDWLRDAREHAKGEAK